MITSLIRATIPITLRIAFGTDCFPSPYSDTLPRAIDTALLICADEKPSRVDPIPLIPENLRDDATFTWHDGDNSPSRKVAQTSSYTIEVATPCFSFPLTIRSRLAGCRS